MIIDKLKIKENISLSAKITAIDLIVEYHFTEDDATGEVKYTPYFSEIGKKITFFQYFVDGWELSDDENAFDAISSSEDMNLFYATNKNIDDFIFVLEQVEDMVDFRKQQLIHKSPLDTLLSSLNSILTQYSDALDNDLLSAFMKKMVASKDLSADAIIKAYSKTNFAKENKNARSQANTTIKNFPLKNNGKANK